MSRSAKRKREDELVRNVKKRKQSTTITNRSDAQNSTMVRGDALKWKRLPLPDRLDDAEGFYDLEEIDDVEVVRDEKNHVMFKAKEDATGKAEHDGEHDEDWNGFDDEEADGVVPDASMLTDGNDSVPKSARVNHVKSILKSSHVDPENGPFDVLSNHESSEHTDVSAWSDLGLNDEMLSAVSSLGFARPTAIQTSALPPILEGLDVIGKAVTGSGKTLVFGIPILQKWSAPSMIKGIPTALILAPTRELAHQLSEHLTRLAEGMSEQPRIVRVTGGLSILKQQRQLERADIIVATPGRLWEVINDSQGLIERLKQIKFLVVDEADRLLTEGHFKEVEDILQTLDREVIDNNAKDEAEPRNPNRQVLVFSATFHKGLHQKLAGRLKATSATNLLSNQQSLAYLLQKLPFRSKPVFLDANPISQMSEHLDESIIESPAMEKDLYLYALLLQNPRLKTLVFTNSISSVKRLAPLLQNLSLQALPLHSSMPQKARLRSLERFTSTSQPQNILLATDVAARGLDIKSIDLIIHYHVPHSADMYVHRSGRTARAEQKGRSILLCSPDEVVPTSRLIAKVHASGISPQISNVDREVIKRIRRRVDLAQKIVETEQAREKSNSKDDWLKKAAEDLGVDYDGDEFSKEERRNQRGRGGGKAKAQTEKAERGKEEVSRWKAELRELLANKVNMGVSERYLAGGRVDVDAILRGKSDAMFLEGR